ncbi:hypothetical protein NLJ89_g8218 [Agrocybe chaxingu]|uniref:Uncharacterized protein n=1 Tax=Agrocybe chaxingu TaxID=84603 RepID=A0A9W8JXU4_9AGAR|nr:hypothetical protein NLJ89_g8218 [Agrocybe chaxingu]
MPSIANAADHPGIVRAANHALQKGDQLLLRYASFPKPVFHSKEAIDDLVNFQEAFVDQLAAARFKDDLPPPSPRDIPPSPFIPPPCHRFLPNCTPPPYCATPQSCPHTLRIFKDDILNKERTSRYADCSRVYTLARDVTMRAGLKVAPGVRVILEEVDGRNKSYWITRVVDKEEGKKAIQMHAFNAQGGIYSDRHPGWKPIVLKFFEEEVAPNFDLDEESKRFLKQQEIDRAMRRVTAGKEEDESPHNVSLLRHSTLLRFHTYAFIQYS